MGSECIHCEGFGICDLFLRSRSSVQAREDRMRCEENHRQHRKVRSKRHKAFNDQEIHIPED